MRFTERERDEAIKQRDESGARFHKAVQYGAELERERDEYAEGERRTAEKNVALQDEIYGLKAGLARRDAADVAWREVE